MIRRNRGWQLPISEAELAGMTAELDEAHHAYLPAMQAAAGELAEQIRDSAEGRAAVATSRRRLLLGGGGLAAAFSPATLVIVAGLLSRERPLRLAFSFLAAAGVVAVAVGFAVVGALAVGGWDDTRRHPSVPPALDLGLGAAALLFAVMVARRAPRAVKVRRGDTRLATAVILGLAMGSPSPLYLLSLHTVAQSGGSSAARYLDVVVLAVIVLLMAEVPILTYLARPEGTAARLAAANSWLARHGRSILVFAAAAVGCYFVVKGLARLG